MYMKKRTQDKQKMHETRLILACFTNLQSTESFLLSIMAFLENGNHIWYLILKFLLDARRLSESQVGK
jgi:hypothetical protein